MEHCMAVRHRVRVDFNVLGPPTQRRLREKREPPPPPPPLKKMVLEPGYCHCSAFSGKSQYPRIFSMPSYLPNQLYLLYGFSYVMISDTVWHFICNDMRDDRDIMRQCRQIYAQGNIYFYVNSTCALMLWRLPVPYSVRTARHCTPRNYGGTVEL